MLIARATAAIFFFFFMISFIGGMSQYADPPTVSWDDRTEITSGEAYQGRWQMNDSDFRYVDDPTLKLNDDSSVYMLWVDQEEQELFFQHKNAEGEKQLDEPVNVSRTTDIFTWLPRMETHPEDPEKIYVLWQDIVFSGGSHGGEIFFAKSEDGGRSFSEPVNLSNTQDGAGKGRISQRYWDNGSLDLAVDADGTIYTSWTEYEGRLRFRKSEDGGASFTEAEVIANEGNYGPARAPSLTASEGTVHLVWSVGELEDADIHYVRSDDKGNTFDQPRKVKETGGHSDAPQIASDNNGRLHLVFGESSSGPLEQYDIHYTRLEQDSEEFESPRNISEQQQDEFQSRNYPTIDVDAAGNVYVLWELFPDNAHESLGLGFATSGDGGRTFASPTVIPGSGDPGLGTNGSRQGSLMRKLSVNDTGQAAVINSTFNPGDASYIWLWRGSVEY